MHKHTFRYRIQHWRQFSPYGDTYNDEEVRHSPENSRTLYSPIRVGASEGMILFPQLHSGLYDIVLADVGARVRWARTVRARKCSSPSNARRLSSDG